jgi:hypothetical protein
MLVGEVEIIVSIYLARSPSACYCVSMSFVLSVFIFFGKEKEN